jgi:hypothetical protein
VPLAHNLPDQCPALGVEPRSARTSDRGDARDDQCRNG